MNCGPTYLHNGVHVFSISWVPSHWVKGCINVVGHNKPTMSEDYNENIIWTICLNLKSLLQVWQSEDWCQAMVTI